MESFIHFFRDTLSGPVYIVVVILAIILIFACIGYLAEKSINKKKEQQKYTEVVAEPGEVIKEAVDTTITAVPKSEPITTTSIIEPQIAPITPNQPLPQGVSVSPVEEIKEQAAVPLNNNQNVVTSPVEEIVPSNPPIAVAPINSNQNEAEKTVVLPQINFTEQK